MRQDLKLIGAAAERKAILRKLRRAYKDYSIVRIWDLIAWLLKRCERYNARKGGLGRKRKCV